MKLTEAQRGKVADLVKSSSRRGRGGFNPAQGNASMADSADGGAGSDAAVEKILDAKQRTRVRQIRLQAEGPMLFTRDELLARLNLDAGQMEMLQQIVGGNSGVSYGLQRDASPDRARGKGQKAKAAPAPAPKAAPVVADGATQQIYGLLRPRQRDVLKKILGEPVNLDPGAQSDDSTPGDEKAVASPAKDSAGSDKPAPAVNASPANPSKPARKSLRERRGQPTGSNP